MLNTGSQGKLRGSDAEKQAVQTAGCGPPVGKVSSRTPHGQISSGRFSASVPSWAAQSCSCDLSDSCRLSGEWLLSVIPTLERLYRYGIFLHRP